LVLQGEPGIGKTLLWERAVERARTQSLRVLSCRGAEAEAGLSLAGLSDQLSDVIREVGSELLPVRREALEVALLLREPGPEPPDSRAIGLALLDVLRLLAQVGPVVVAVDDIQWLDPPSAGALQLALRRLKTERVGLLATLRVAHRVASPVDLDRMLAEHELVRLCLGPLDLAALHQLLRRRLGVELARPELRRVSETTGGNPFFALELGRELARDDGWRTGAGPPPVPGSVATLLGKRLERLTSGTREVLLLAAPLPVAPVNVERTASTRPV
jgi:predicted ATPase